jgi:predicted dinucleotide-binding enzyme
MNIAIIGAGNVGTTVGASWSRAGHTVAYGVRAPEDDKYTALADHAAVMAVADAVATAGVVVLAVPWRAAEATLLDLGEALDGKVLIDATNPIKTDFSGLIMGHNDSGGEQVARWAPRARVVKALNSAFTNVMADPLFPGGRSVMLVAGDAPEARKLVAGLCEDLGFTAQELGGIEDSRMIEAFGWTLINLAMKYGLGNQIGFALLRRSGSTP